MTGYLNIVKTKEDGARIEKNYVYSLKPEKKINNYNRAVTFDFEFT